MSEPILDYQSPSARGHRGRGKQWVFVLIGLIGFALAISVLLPSLRHPRHEHYGRTRCLANLRSIGMALQLYATENRGAMPPDLVTLLITQDVVSEMFVCQLTNDKASRSTQPADRQADFAGGGHCSYVYVGWDGKLGDAAADAIVAYEPAANHKVALILCADGQVELVEAKRLTDSLAKRSTGSPVRLLPE